MFKVKFENFVTIFNCVFKYDETNVSNNILLIMLNFETFNNIFLKLLIHSVPTLLLSCIALVDVIILLLLFIVYFDHKVNKLLGLLYNIFKIHNMIIKLSGKILFIYELKFNLYLIQ